LELAKDLLYKFKDKIILPEDVLVASSVDKYAQVENVNIYTNPHTICENDHTIVDIGEKTIELYSSIIEKAKTIIWNGPLGIYEIEKFAHGTKEIGKVVADVSRGKPFGLVGGGNVVTALEKMKVIRGIDYVSTGGGAMLEFLGGKRLPGIEVIEDKDRL
jgi:phosphoglycerate kinase